MRVSEGQAVALLHELVATPSVSGQEHRAVELLVRAMAELGMRAWIDRAGNAIGQVGSDASDARELLLLGHIDTVPGWLPVGIQGRWLTGRGSVDAKGPLCAMVLAAASARLPAGVRLVVAGAVGEETPGSPGATALRDRHRPAACIIGEPSGWQRYTIGYKGRLIVHALFEQDAGHSAHPGGSVGDAALVWHRRVMALVRAHNRGRRGAFGTLAATCQGMATASDGLRDQAELTIGLRLPPGCDPSELESRLRQTARVQRLGFEGHAKAHLEPRSSPVAGALASAIARAGGRPVATTKTGTSDMNTVAQAFACPIAAYGPGDSALDHTPKERLDLDEYLRSIGVLTDAIEHLAEDGLERCALACGHAPGRRDAFAPAAQAPHG
ncbi:MAG: acetyl-lysine deacetylase [Phycisphaerales bacterium]|nr:MAG: acetyl-lysine deacetylase [Phycisphaerales bacterium]